MRIPPVIGFEADEAREALRRAGIRVLEERVTRPPWPGEPAGTVRVISARPETGGVVLILAHESYNRNRVAGLEGGRRRA